MEEHAKSVPHGQIRTPANQRLRRVDLVKPPPSWAAGGDAAVLMMNMVVAHRAG